MQLYNWFVKLSFFKMNLNKSHKNIMYFNFYKQK